MAKPMWPYTHKSHHWKNITAEQKKRKEQLKEDESLHCAQRVGLARSLSGLFGNPYDEGWPVDWSGGFAWIGVPPNDGIIDEDFLIAKHDSYMRVPRNVGIDILSNVWDKFQHFGEVPSRMEVHSAATLAKASGMLCVDKVGHDEMLYDYGEAVYKHATDTPGEPRRTIVSPATPHTTNGKVPVAVDSWLMDSGTPLDIVNKASIAGNRHRVRKIDRIVLDTANGQNVADRGIDLVVELLGQDILPYVLDSSPNVLSIGRRCVVDGYGWYWPPYSLSPYLIHPVSGEFIYMRVEDYCPYLDNHGTYFPTGLGPIAAVCTVMHRTAATASVAPRATAAPGSASSSDAPAAPPLVGETSAFDDQRS